MGSAVLTATNATVGLTATPASNTGSTPSTFAVADFDRDGISDLVTANTRENTLSILHWNPDATFTERSTIAVPVPPTLVTTGDLNSDAVQDLVVTSRSTNTITILLGKPDGSFTTGATLATGAGPQGTLLADFNGDGFPDIATADTDGGMVSFFVGIGHGNFFPGASNVDVPGKPVSMVVADFNNDGVPDLATSNLDGTVTVLLGRGGDLCCVGFTTSTCAQSWRPWSDRHRRLQRRRYSRSRRACSFDRIRIRSLGKGDGTFTLRGIVPASGVQSIEVADFNGDGISDFAVTKTFNAQSSVVLFLGAGDGTFSEINSAKSDIVLCIDGDRRFQRRQCSRSGGARSPQQHRGCPTWRTEHHGSNPWNCSLHAWHPYHQRDLLGLQHICWEHGRGYQYQRSQTCD